VNEFSENPPENLSPTPSHNNPYLVIREKIGDVSFLFFPERGKEKTKKSFAGKGGGAMYTIFLSRPS